MKAIYILLFLISLVIEREVRNYIKRRKHLHSLPERNDCIIRRIGWKTTMRVVKPSPRVLPGGETTDPGQEETAKEE